MIATKRVYDPPSKDDGFRVLVDRLWPRGLTKQKAHVDLWLKEIGPSDELRKWFHHEDRAWPEFEKRYRAELRPKKDLLAQIKGLEKEHAKLTLVYGSKDETHNQATVLTALLQGKK
jgi:uncharacterized protein YeaO (DUF488 family)